MPLSADLAAAFRYIANEVSNLNEVQYFDSTMEKYTKELEFGGRRFDFMKLGYSRSGTFAGIGYAIKLLKPNSSNAEWQWVIWIINPSDVVAVNRRAVVAGI